MGKATSFVCVIALGLILVASGGTDDEHDLDKKGVDGLSQPYNSTEHSLILEDISQKTIGLNSKILGDGTESPDTENRRGRKRNGNSRYQQQGERERGSENGDEDSDGKERLVQPSPSSEGQLEPLINEPAERSPSTDAPSITSEKPTNETDPKLSTCTVSVIENGEIGRYETRHRRGEKSEFKKVDTGSSVSSGETLFFRCKGDFLPLEGSQFVRSNRLEVTCNDGTWSKDLQCKPNNSFCAYPPDIEGAVTPLLQGDKYPLGTTITYRCPFGYVSRNSINHISACRIDSDTGKAQWTTPEISCNRPRSCGDPGYLNNGHRKGNLFTFPNKVEYECDEGYKLRGLSARFCQAGGEWSGRLPTCEPIYCDAPTNPVNGRVSYSSLEYGTELKYECNTGFLLKDPQTRMCSEDGSWSNAEPECIEATCDAPQPPKHGSVKLHGELKVNSIATYSCDPGRELLGATTTKCLISGKWTFDAPDCLSTCTVPFIENGEIGRYETRYTRRGEEFKKVVAGSSVSSGETLFFRCKGDFLPLEGSQFVRSNRLEVTCNDGTWSKNLQCKPTRCTGSPPPSKNARPAIDSREHGYTIYYKCIYESYTKIIGNVTCHFGSWIGFPPKCLNRPCYKKDLNYPGLVTPSEEHFESSESFDISCEIGYRKTSIMQTITCARGRWDVSENPCRMEREEIVTTDKRKATHEEIQPNTNVESSTPRITAVNRECVCSLSEIADPSVTVRVGDTKLEAGDTIKLGENASFECKSGNWLTWRNGFRFAGKANMACSTCILWSRADLPTCTPATRSDTVIRYDGELNILPGGVIAVQREVILRLQCISTREYPFWFTGRRSDIATNVYHQFTEGGRTYYINYLDIVQAKERHTGRYECYNRNYDGSQIGTTVLDLKVNAEEDRSISTLAPRGTSFTTEIPTHIHRETSTHETAGVIPNKDCSCTYEHEDASVNAQIGNKILKFGDQIKKGEKVSFHCKYARTFLKFQNGLRLTSTANMTCTACKNWKEKDVPTCENSQESDSLIGFAENLDILPGGNVSIQKRVKHRFSCSNNWKQPEWNYGQRNYVSVTPTTTSSRRGLKVYITYLEIRKEETELHGKYECYIHDDQGRRKSTFLHLQVTDYASCPEFSNLKDLRVNYSNGVSIGSTARFRCLETTKTLIGSDSSICQEDGVWSSPLPSCEDSKCSIGNLSIMVPENVVPDISEDAEEHVTIGSVVRLKCNNNEVMTGEREAQCEKQGKWKLGRYQCVPGCILDLDPTSHLIVDSMKDSYRIGELVSLSCPPGKEMSNKVERLMCLLGGWSDSLPECIENSGRR